MALVSPLLAAGGVSPVAKVVLGTVKGDLHDIGKNLVGMMLQGGGFEVIDLGTDIAAEQFVAAIEEKKATLVAMSRPADYDHAVHDPDRPGHQGQGAQVGEDDDRRRPGHTAVRQRNRSRRLRPDAASAVEVANRLVKAQASAKA